ncbi:hypothetical protein BDZ85DRAFT_260928 [Elsinoe ampelina]|uniref:Uncharacterized protein n=1 Tax=Elsinoe ampelina TaxID=302913 RepID=A0A6A6GFM2_9PEZI|nr:hypothetical protein BDZ85DRAFT_260928 [Elsinoe ampelina]
MPCGASTSRRIARAAVSSSKGLWITDDALDHTFNRFFRIPGDQHRRHGSHVPGPLEARKRQGKRRMGLSTCFDAPTSSVWPDLRSMFRIGSLFDSRPVDSRWTWTPPTPRKTEDSTGSKVLRTPATVRDRSIKEPASIPDCKNLEEIRTLYWQTCPLGEDSIKFTDEALDHYLNLVRKHASGQKVRRRRKNEPELIELLRSEVNNAQSKSMQRVFTWLVAQNINSNAYLRELSRGVLQLAIDKFETDVLDAPEMTQIVETLCQKIASGQYDLIKLPKIYTSLMGLKDCVLARLQSEPDDARLSCLAGSLHDFCRQCLTKTRWITWMTFTAQLPRGLKVTYTADIVIELVATVRRDVAQRSLGGNISSIAAGAFLAASQSRLDWQWWADVCERVTTSLLYERESMKVPRRWLDSLRDAAAQQSASDECQALMNRVDDIIRDFHIESASQTAVATSEGLSDSAQGIPKKSESVVVGSWSHSPQVATALIHMHLAENNVWRAKWTFDRSRAVKPSRCKDLFSAMVAKGHDQSSTYLEMFRRPETTPASSPDGQHEAPEVLSDVRVRMVENLATAISLSDQILDGRALRMTWKLFQYLRNHSAPIRVQMVRALVRTSVIRYLSHDARIRHQRTDRVLQLVKEVEGDKVAQLLQTMIIDWQLLIDQRLLTGRVEKHPLQRTCRPHAPQARPIVRAFAIDTRRGSVIRQRRPKFSYRIRSRMTKLRHRVRRLNVHIG